MFRHLIFDPCYAYFLQIPRIGIIFINYLIRDNAKNARVIDTYVISLLFAFNFHFQAISRNKSRIKVANKKLDFSPIDTIGEITL